MSKKSQNKQQKKAAKKRIYRIFDGSWKKIALSKDQFVKLSKWRDYLKIKGDTITVVVSKGVEFPPKLRKYISDNEV